MSYKSWNNLGGGSWDDDTGWTPTGAPTIGDTVAISSFIGSRGTDYLELRGTGTAASLTATGYVGLVGSYGFGLVNVGTSSSGGALQIASGTVLTATSITLQCGALIVDGTGTTVGATKTLTLGGERSGPYATGNNILNVSGGTVVCAGSLLLQAVVQNGVTLTDPQANTISVDTYSSIEIGTLNGAAAGMLTIDPDGVLSGTGSLTAHNGIANNGVVRASYGILRLGSRVVGTGRMEVETGATLLFNASAEGGPASAQDVTFLGTSGTLALWLDQSAAAGGSMLSYQGVIRNLDAGNRIEVSTAGLGSGEAITAAYNAGSDGLGSIQLTNGSQSFGALAVAGNHEGEVVQIIPLGASTVLMLVSGGTQTPDTYEWRVVGSSGAWNSAVNWTDTTSGSSPAAIAPGTRNAAHIAGGTDAAFSKITGSGSAASLTVDGNVALDGTFDTTVMAIGTPAPFRAVGKAGAVRLEAGTLLTTRAATVLDGSLTVSGMNTRLVDTGTLTVGGKRGTTDAKTDLISVSAGGSVQVDQAILASSAVGYIYNGRNSITVDKASTFEVGFQGGVGLGVLQVDAGKSLTGCGDLHAAAGIVNNGIIKAQSGELTLASKISGSGELQIDVGATMVFSSGTHDPANSYKLRFLGASGTLLTDLTPSNAYYDRLPEHGVIYGFKSGNVIAVNSVNQTVTGARYQASSSGTGTLALLHDEATIGELTLAGTYSGAQFTVTSSYGRYSIGVSGVPAVASDVTGDRISDILLQSGGTVVDWIMKDGTYQDGHTITTGADGYAVVGKGDFNGDGTADVLLQNGGTVVEWLMKDGAYQSGNTITTAVEGYRVVGTGDFNGDGTSDILLQSGGTVVAWLMKNGTYQAGNTITTGADGFTVVGTGDFNGDGTSDILLQNGGTVVEWLMKDGAYQSGGVITTGADGFTVVGTGDFNGDGTDDVVLQNGGTVVDWIMKNGAYQSGNVLTTAAEGYTVRGTGDFNGDGTADIVLQNGGTVVGWIMKDGAYQSGTVITTGATGFTVV